VTQADCQPFPKGQNAHLTRCWGHFRDHGGFVGKSGVADLSPIRQAAWLAGVYCERGKDTCKRF
jgi:hypothetical protein